MTEPRTHARFPEAAAGAAHYESFYLKACRPGGGLGVWIRYTVLKPPGAPAAGSLWCTLFDAAAPAPAAAKVTLAPDRLRRPAGGYLAVGAASFEPGRVAPPRPGPPRPPGTCASSRPRPPMTTSRGRGCTAPRCRGRSCTVPTRPSASTATSPSVTG